MAPKFDRMVTYIEGLLPIMHSTLWPHGLVRSRNKLNLYYHNACDHQTWQDGDKSCAAPTHDMWLQFGG